MYVIATAADLPQVVDRWRIYHLLYDPGAGAGLYYSPDAINLTRLATGGATLPAGTVDTSILRWNAGGAVWAEFTSFLLPPADGALDQIMQTDGAGVVSWIDIPASIVDGTILHATLRWDSANWVENDNILIDPAGDITIQGDATTGFVNMDSPIIFGPYSGVTGALYGFSYTAVESFTGAFVGGGLNFSGTIGFTNATFIYESFRGSPAITTGVNPGFAAYTVLQALPTLIAGSGAGHNPLNMVTLNSGGVTRNPFAGSRTSTVVNAVNSWLLMAGNLWELYLFAVVYGFGWGAVAVLRFAIAAEAFGLASVGLMMGILGFSESLAATFSAYFAGSVFDLAGSYDTAFILCIAISFMGILMSWWLKPDRILKLKQ
ncbi:MAG: hypothetical protein GQ553_00525 [Nitrosomonadaceae bacterium]|nr:hypothetical protein [Nitrosomonadaceae bacterium]